MFIILLINTLWLGWLSASPPPLGLFTSLVLRTRSCHFRQHTYQVNCEFRFHKLSKRSLLCLVLQQVKGHLYVRRFQKINIIFCRYHKYKTSILSILWKKERKEGGNTEHDLNVVSGIQLSNQFKPPISLNFK